MAGAKKKIWDEPLRLPYDGALKAYAYARIPFESALTGISQCGFPIPVPNTPVFIMMKKKYSKMIAESKALDAYTHFDHLKTEELGIYPLFEWIRSDEGDRSYEIDLVQSVMYNIMCIPLRRMVSVLLYQMVSYKTIEDLMISDWRAPVVKWSAEQIDIYHKFFWDTGEMSNDNWNKYLNMLPEKNKTVDYVHDIASGRHGLTWHGYPPTDVDTLLILRSIFAQQSHDYFNSLNINIALAANRTAMTIHNIETSRGDGDGDKPNPLSDVEILITDERRRRYGVQEDGFLDAGVLDGNMNDPKEFTQSFQEYLDDK